MMLEKSHVYEEMGPKVKAVMSFLKQNALPTRGDNNTREKTKHIATIRGQKMK